MTTSPPSDSAAKKDVTKLQRAIVDGLEDVKAQDIQVFNTEHLSPLFERVIVASGTSNRQTKALAASVRDAVRKVGFDKPRTEGEENGEWIIVDCGAVVAHIMQPMIRQYYRLEDIWGEKPVRLKLASAKPRRVEASEDASADTAAPVKKAAKTVKAAAKPTVAKKSPAKAATKTAAKTTVIKTTAKTAAKTPTKAAAKVAGQAATVKKAVVAKVPAKKVVVKTSAASPKPVAKKAPVKAAAKKAAGKTTAKATTAKAATAKAGNRSQS